MLHDDLKRRVSQMDDADLLSMVAHHGEYRRDALDYAIAELTRRNIPFVTPPPKSPPPKPKKKTGGNIISIIACFVLIGIIANTIYIKISSPGGMDSEELLWRLGAAAIVAAVLFLRLTTDVLD